MAQFSSAIALAQRLVLKNGRTVTLKRRGTTEVDPAKPWLSVQPAPTSTDISLPAVFIEFRERQIDGEIVRQGDQMCLMAAADIATGRPTTDDTVQDGNVNWKIVNVSTIRPGTSDILYKLQVRS